MNWTDYTYLCELLLNKKSLNENLPLERLASILKKNLDKKDVDKFLNIAHNNPHRISIWSNNIKNQNDLQEKINDWQKRNIWIDDYETESN
jgi:hypothetical protein